MALPWFWSRIKCRTTQLGYMKGGFQQLYNRLGEEIAQAGGTIRLNTTVTRIAAAPDHKITRGDRRRQRGLRQGIATLPTRLFLKLTDGLPDDYRKRYDWGSALGAHV